MLIDAGFEPAMKGDLDDGNNEVVCGPQITGEETHAVGLVYNLPFILSA